MPDPLLGFDLQSFSPPVQPYAVSDAVALLAFLKPPGSAFRKLASSASAETATANLLLPSGSLDGSLRLQGFAPHESPPLPFGCLGLRERVALLGFIPFRAFSLTGRARPSPRLPS
jgi:hypothetical protein